MVVASLYPARRIVVKPISCEHTSILVDNMLEQLASVINFACLWWNITMKNILFLLQRDAFLATTYGEI